MDNLDATTPAANKMFLFQKFSISIFTLLTFLVAMSIASFAAKKGRFMPQATTLKDSLASGSKSKEE